MGSRNHLPAAVTAAVVTLFLVLVGCSSPEGSAPGATPSPAAVAPTDRFGQVLAFSTVGRDSVFAVTSLAKCPSCATLWTWKRGQTRWTRVHDLGIPKHPRRDEGHKYPPVDTWSLAMADNGRDGYLAWDGALRSTSDGGRSWTAVDLPGEQGTSGTPVISQGFVIVLVPPAECLDDACGAGALWRARVGTEDWEKLEQPTEGYYYRFFTSGDAVLLTATFEGREDILRSNDAGRSWQKVSPPPGTPRSEQHCTGRPTGERIAVATCLTRPDGPDVLKASTDGRSWRSLHEFGTYQHSPEYASMVLSIDERRLLVSSERRNIVVSPDGSWVPMAGPPPGLYPDAGSRFVTADIGVLLDERGRLWQTADSARTWRLLPQQGGRQG